MQPLEKGSAHLIPFSKVLVDKLQDLSLWTYESVRTPISQRTSDGLNNHNLMTSDSIQVNHEIAVLIKRIERQPAFTAYGFFTVDRSTLTAELGIVLTYFIVLYQANLC